MKLDGKQTKQIHNALLSAFPSKASLERLVLFHLDTQLNQVVGEGSLSDLVVELIKWAESQGKLEALLIGAGKENPGNKILQTCIAELGYKAGQPTSRENSIQPRKRKFEFRNVSIVIAVLAVIGISFFIFTSYGRNIIFGPAPTVEPTATSSILVPAVPTGSKDVAPNTAEPTSTSIPLNQIGPEQVVVCSEPNFLGDCRLLDNSVASFNDAEVYGALSNQLASVRLDEKTIIKVRLYQDENWHENASRFEMTVDSTDFDLRQRDENTYDWDSLEIIQVTDETTSVPTATTIVDDDEQANLYIQGEAFGDGLYLVKGTGTDRIDLGNNLVVYAEIVPGTEVAIALVRVVNRNPDSLTIQPVLIHPESKIRSTLRVDADISNLSTSELIPDADYAVGYMLDDGKIFLRPSVDITVGANVQALQLELIDDLVVDALPFNPPVIMRVTAIGSTGNVARVEIVEGEWPPKGTLVRLDE